MLRSTALTVPAFFRTAVEPAAGPASMSRPPAPVAEIVTFRLRPGTAAADFVELARATEAAVSALPGFRRRSLSCDADGQWTDYVEWDDAAAARAAASAVMTLPGFAPFGAVIDNATMEMRHSAILWSMSR